MATVYIGSDHAGLELKAALVKRLSEKGHDVHDLGPATTESCDYPVYAKGVCGKVLADAGNATPGDEPASFGILVCGTGIGMSMTANHIPGIRAALCGCEFQARATRQHNNANVLCLGERVIGQGVALDIAELFLNTAFEGGRHLPPHQPDRRIRAEPVRKRLWAATDGLPNTPAPYGRAGGFPSACFRTRA